MYVYLPFASPDVWYLLLLTAYLSMYVIYGLWIHFRHFFPLLVAFCTWNKWINILYQHAGNYLVNRPLIYGNTHLIHSFVDHKHFHNSLMLQYYISVKLRAQKMDH